VSGEKDEHTEILAFVFLVGLPSSAVFAGRFFEVDFGVAGGLEQGDFTSSSMSFAILIGIVAASSLLIAAIMYDG